MAKTMNRSRRVLVGALFLALSAPTVAAARKADPENATAKGFVVGRWAFDRLQQAHQLLGEEKYDEALQVLDRMEHRGHTNSHEKALVWQTYGYVYSSIDQYDKAAQAFERCLAEDALVDQAQLDTRYNLAQIYVLLEQHDKAIPMFLDWFERAQNPSATAHYMLAMAYVQADQYDKALPYAKEAVARANTPKESWLQLVVSLLLAEKNYEDSAPVLEQLVEYFPKKTYWLQLSAVYSQLGKEKNALAIMELANEQGLLTDGTELKNLAQLYLSNQIPDEAAEVLDKGLNNGTIQSTKENWEMLANSLLYARERRRSAEAMRRAAEMAENGDLYVRLAHTWLEEWEWQKAIEALDAAFRKGSLSSPGNAYLLLGIASANAEKTESAEHAFVEATNFEQTKKVATLWLAKLEAESATSQQ
jgi:tetratricopeptide (TPR) repeat protein